MRRACIVTALGLGMAVLSGGWVGQAGDAGAPAAPAASTVQWIWYNEGDPSRSAPAETRYFRRVFTIDRPLDTPVDEGSLDITADDGFTVWINGVKVGQGDDWKKLYHFDVTKKLASGENVIAVEGRNRKKGSAGLIVRLAYTPNGWSRLLLVSDGDWKASKTAAEGWQRTDFKDSTWSPVKVLGPYGQTRPWQKVAQAGKGGGPSHFTVPEGFRVELAVRRPAEEKNFSLVNMTFDDKGRLLVSHERGPILLCTEPDKDGVLQKVEPYCTQVTNCQGMCWVKNALLLVGTGPEGTGLYRVRDTKDQDQTDEVTLLHKFQGDMAEHGPHAILHGPDNWLYVVIGNHALAKVDKLAANSPLTRWPTGEMGPDQGKPDTTEDVLLSRMNDARGHAADKLAPGGTIWRLDHEGKNFSLVAGGFRNEFDAAFSPTGELFTFDSDMEWDENLPWYRAVRICHCPPGADFVWRTGAANTPDYYLDSLPPIYETGRGSPVGVEFYDHNAFPKEYRGTVFMADWSLGIIYAVHPQHEGASYKAKVEKFCTGAPMNVTDCEVGPDGALYFVMGGRGTQGGVYRIVYGDGKAVAGAEQKRRPDLQPLAAFSRATDLANLPLVHPVPDGLKDDLKMRAFDGQLQAQLLDANRPALDRIRDMTVMVLHHHLPAKDTLLKLTQDKDADVRAHVLWLLSANPDNGYSGVDKQVYVSALKDTNAFVRRRACEALIRAGVEPPVEDLWPLLGEKDRFLVHAARLVLERMDPNLYADRLWKETQDPIAWQGIVALCHTNKAAPYAEALFGRLRGAPNGKDVKALLDYVRTVQLALIHVPTRPVWVKGIAQKCDKLFPHPDWRVNRELAILLTAFQREGQLDHPAVGKLYNALLHSKDDRLQQIHYFYCLRLLKDGWTPEQKQGLASWYDGTKSWRGGHSFTPFLENIFKDVLQTYTLDERKQLLAAADKAPLPALVLAQRLQVERNPELLPALSDLVTRLNEAEKMERGKDLRQAVFGALAKTALAKPGPESWPYLVRGLESGNSLVIAESLAALRKLPKLKPKADEPAPYRALLESLASLKDPKDPGQAKTRWQVVELLRQWNGRSFGAEPGKADAELRLWTRWFGQAFPKEPPLSKAASEATAESKYKMAELLSYLNQGADHQGDVSRGRLVFEKATCSKCHKHGKEGEGVGPDLSDLAKRFKRVDILESILDPSKVISDQYRSVTIITTSGQQITGLAAVEGDTVSVVLSDASKVTLKRDEIDSQVASVVSVMPERLLDPLSLQEIADLIAFLESEP